MTSNAEAQTPRARAITPVTALSEANAEARRRPDPANFTDATQVYDYAPGAIYEVYGAPGFISTILLEPGEAIVTVAAGDTTRWMVEQAIGGDIASPRAMLLVKPTRASIRTNIVLVTDRRSYSIEAIAVAGQTYSAQTAWRYPVDADASLAGGPHGAEQFNFAYRIRTIRGAAPRWRPVRVFDDGQKTYIEFPPAMATSEAPPLFITERGEAALVNYRVQGSATWSTASSMSPSCVLARARRRSCASNAKAARNAAPPGVSEDGRERSLRDARACARSLDPRAPAEPAPAVAQGADGWRNHRRFHRHARALHRIERTARARGAPGRRASGGGRSAGIDPQRIRSV
jgi:P-type conjugative transfer protein TrbG